jgi:hypothetical protein
MTLDHPLGHAEDTCGHLRAAVRTGRPSTDERGIRLGGELVRVLDSESNVTSAVPDAGMD